MDHKPPAASPSEFSSFLSICTLERVHFTVYKFYFSFLSEKKKIRMRKPGEKEKGQSLQKVPIVQKLGENTAHGRT